MARKNPADVHRRKRGHKKEEHEGRVTLEDAAAARDPATRTRPAPWSIAPPITRLTAIIKINPGMAGPEGGESSWRTGDGGPGGSRATAAKGV